jgi:sugar lactone lactonase YvrE
MRGQHLLLKSGSRAGRMEFVAQTGHPLARRVEDVHAAVFCMRVRDGLGSRPSITLRRVKEDWAVRRERRTLGTGGARGIIVAGLILVAAVPSSASEVRATASAATPGPLSTGRVERFAGDGLEGELGDGHQANAAELRSPQGLAADAHGNTYIADYGSGSIRRVNAKGRITTIAGGHGSRDTGDGGPAKAAGLAPPRSVAIGADGKVYLLGEGGLGNARVRVIDGSGNIRAFAGTDTAGFSGDGGPATSALLDHPHVVAADGLGNVYIGEQFRIRRVNASGIISTIAGTGVSGFSGDGGPATAAELLNVTALAADGAGNLYVSDGARVRRIDHASGTITTVAGTGVAGFSGDGGPATAAKILFGSAGLAVDRFGVLYISDSHNHRVRAVDTAGRITTVVGGGTSSLAGGWGGPARNVLVFDPRGLAVDRRGGLLIAEDDAPMVLRFTRGLTVSQLSRCTRAAARQEIEQRGLGQPRDVQDPAAQVFCGAFTGRHSHAMVVSLRLPSCGGSGGWVVFRSVHGRWQRVLYRHAGADLTRSGRRIVEWQGVLGPHDAHCFPSSYRMRVWHWNGNRLVHSSWHRERSVPKHLPGIQF